MVTSAVMSKRVGQITIIKTLEDIPALALIHTNTQVRPVEAMA